MVIKKNNNILKKENQFNDSQLDELKNILSSAFGSSGENGDGTNSIKELETAKLILAIITDGKNLDSTTNLSEIEIEEIANARYLNLIFDDDLVDEFVVRFLSLKRSQTKDSKNLLNILADITGKVNDSYANNLGISRIIGDRFKTR